MAVAITSVFDLRFLYRLPLHIRRNIRPAALKRNDVINDVTLPSFQIITDQGQHLGIHGTASCSVPDASFPSKKLRRKQIICGVELHELDED